MGKGKPRARWSVIEYVPVGERAPEGYTFGMKESPMFSDEQKAKKFAEESGRNCFLKLDGKTVAQWSRRTGALPGFWIDRS